MAGQLPPPSALPWGWVIEALANFKEVDVTTLIDVFNRSPKITSHVGSTAREMASFRTLERLFDPDTQSIKSVFCAPNSGVSFDFSERCEDVLRRILEEMHGTIWEESEKSKWDAQPFIAHKRSCLLKSDLRRVKDTLMEGRPSYLTSLKQMVTSLRLNQPGTRIRDVNGAIFNNQQQSPCIDDKLCQDTSNEGNRKDECFDDVKLQGEQSTRTGTLNGEDGDDVEQSSESQSSSDHDLYHEEMNDIAVKKQAFFDSNCKDREVATHWEVAKRCMKCNKGGQLLICSFDACSFVFHDSCLVSTSSFDYDSTRKFYCPFCRYSQSILDYWEAKRKASLARNDLGSFNSSTLKHIPKKSRKRLRVSEKNATREDKAADEKNEASTKRDKNNVIRVVNTQCKVIRKDVTEDNDHVSRGERGKIETDGDPVSNPDLPNESSGTEGCNEGSWEQAEYMDHSIRLRKQIKPCTYLHVPQKRRVPVPWTQLEEETLKNKEKKKKLRKKRRGGRSKRRRKKLERERLLSKIPGKPSDEIKNRSHIRNLHDNEIEFWRKRWLVLVSPAISNVPTRF